MRKIHFAFVYAVILGGLAACEYSIADFEPELNTIDTPVVSLEESVNLAIVRPFSHHDVQKMVDSFDSWSRNMPCSGPRNVDLVLFNSRRLHKASPVVRLVSPLLDDFHNKTANWHTCFRSISLESANIPKRLDIYNKTGGMNWVLGPNIQFNRMLKMAKTSQSAQTMFLMEADTVPQVGLWLDLLLYEIEKKRPFMILGSRYLGSCWFYESPENRYYLSHLNGNAIYNLTHPVLHELHDKLTEKLDSRRGNQPFDVRIEELDYNNPGHDERFRQSEIIGNFLRTMESVASSSGHALIHGAVSRYPWPKNETIDLVVTNYHGEEGLLRLRHELEHATHPFNRVYVYSENVFGSTELPISGTELITLQHTNFSSLHDWVLAPTTASWVAYTNTYFSLLNTHLTGDIREGKFRPSIPYDARRNCTKKKRKNGMCSPSIDDAKVFSPDYAKDVPTTSAVFKADLRKPFFRDWLATTVNRGEGRYPTTNDYFSWCEEKNIGIYDYLSEDKVCPLHNFALNAPFKSISLLSVGNDIPFIYRQFGAKLHRFACFGKLVKEDCLNSGCHWYSAFRKCSPHSRSFGNIRS